MARVQLALNVSDVDAAVAFYGKLFGVEPAKRRPGYANFAIDTPPLKLVLIENPEARGAGVAGALNHLGVEVESTEEVSAATARLAGAGLATAVEENTTCCYALQDKVWVDDPDGAPWEVYTVLADSDSARPGSTGSVAERLDGQEQGAGCCTPSAVAAVPAGAVNLLAGAPVSTGHCC
ncbi:VOC family protein [Frankia sp. AgB1.9]|uniref:ArsI/CadI family heavy metal resistance metalloenzyme n=1 Tax=unclassified Frankia TaxID=2632575 RepID=UPI00193139E7|nr:MULTISPECIES: ArsI/CadI family heavy metal resistance metalloenzyme [unclassified Frankia]MBL7486708.1 VOC family protein [Frankia sp. AgW1.1]MBL7554084.1 VOC family protein [Frankia sp. AgB1.9]MBL7618374.1 VOC family protein [Frankia sp. AgB1.8]